MDGRSSVIGLIRSKLLKKPVAAEEASERLKTPLMDCIENIIECAVDYRYMYCRYGRGVACMYTVIVQVRSPFMYVHCTCTFCSCGVVIFFSRFGKLGV